MVAITSTSLRGPLESQTSITNSVCILPVWDTGQLTLHCQYPIEEATLVWWITVRMTLCALYRILCLCMIHIISSL